MNSTLPETTATSGVPVRASMSTPSCERPPERAAPHVSLYADDPATGQTMPLRGGGGGGGGAGRGGEPAPAVAVAGVGRQRRSADAGRTASPPRLGPAPAPARGGAPRRLRPGRPLGGLRPPRPPRCCCSASSRWRCSSRWLGHQRLADPLVLEPLALDLLEVHDLGLGAPGGPGTPPACPRPPPGCPPPPAGWPPARRGPGRKSSIASADDSVTTSTSTSACSCSLGWRYAGQQRDAGAAARHEAVDGDLLDLSRSASTSCCS